MKRVAAGEEKTNANDTKEKAKTGRSCPVRQNTTTANVAASGQIAGRRAIRVRYHVTAPFVGL